MLRKGVDRVIKRRFHLPKPSEIWRNAPKENAECVVIGAGVVGLAVARELSLKGKEVLVLDSAPTFGTATSSRNSEVIHAGIYYPPDSLKARFCVRGRNLLYQYCSQRGIPHDQIGKLIVATGASEIPKLSELFNRGIRNGVEDLRMLDASEAIKMEPELHCVKALLSPASGIVDSHSLMLSLVGEAETNGATFSYNTAVIGGHLEGNQMALHVYEIKTLANWDGEIPLQPDLLLIPKFVVNSSGLSAPALAKRFQGLNTATIPPACYARGSYFTLSNSDSSRRPPFKHLIYPIPEEGGLGVHVTLDLDGQIKFGPDVEWIHHHVPDTTKFLNRFDYSVNAERVARFYPEIRKYYPNLKDGSLLTGYSGIRPKLHGPGQSATDFVIQGEDIHGVGGLVNLYGIESPGLTSSMAIAEYVAAMLLGG
ncbi:L-2-hydroxyglutarate dehydrogenase, mitochondrial isoform X2 [Hibiscus syriacus]|uniref:L-2-hydroxyglutarate dehydrogenase, mitochondrial isoform X2 n=1 Tax=Hibiscus syriacus TaxID=106335 RepID=UPI001923A4AC|nr:L-2-hydroxyglutarate dehydrogenase, mitochondrial isoform X2 [Hibiscus syriacus]